MRNRRAFMTSVALAATVLIPAGLAQAAPAPAAFAVTIAPVVAPGAVQHPPLTASATVFAQLRAVSCPSATACFAVGSFLPGGQGSHYQPLIESFNGTRWSISPAAVPHAMWTKLFGISCVSATDCMAVGGWNPAGVGFEPRPFAEHWNGTAWSIVFAPQPAAVSSELNAVSCPAAGSCMAVGQKNFDVGPPGPSPAAFAEQWDGTRWTLLQVQLPRHKVSNLQAVSCRTATDCTATGLFAGAQSIFAFTLIEHWDGSAWAIVPSPNGTNNQFNDLAGVSCVSGTACMAAGVFYVQKSGGIFFRDLSEQLNGTAWSLVTVPAIARPSSPQFSAVSCTAADACTAAGTILTRTGSQVPQAARWNGTTWSPVLLPAPGPKALLDGVSCARTTVCVAVGQDSDAQGDTLTLTELWQGGTWKVVPSPSP